MGWHAASQIEQFMLCICIYTYMPLYMHIIYMRIPNTSTFPYANVPSQTHRPQGQVLLSFIERLRLPIRMVRRILMGTLFGIVYCISERIDVD
jgi:hypothetical protein